MPEQESLQQRRHNVPTICGLGALAGSHGATPNDLPFVGPAEGMASSFG
jgi:hypothetical protein